MQVTGPRKKAAPRGRSSVASTGYVLLFAVIVVLNLVGLVMVLSASSVNALHVEGSPFYYFERQLMWLTLGTVVFLITLRFDYRKLRRWAIPLLGLSIFLLVLVLVPGIGVNANGSSRWIGVGSFGIQPSEFAKLGVLLFTADLLSRRAAWIADTRVTLRPVLVVFAVIAGLIMMQPNLGTTIVIASITFAMLFSAGVPLGPLAGYGTAGVLLASGAAMGGRYRPGRAPPVIGPR